MLKRSGILLPPHIWPPVFRQDLQGSACKADAKPRHCVWLALVVFSLPVSLVGNRPKPTIFLLKFTHYGTLLIWLEENRGRNAYVTFGESYAGFEVWSAQTCMSFEKSDISLARKR